jgi:hypothetical protein
MTVIHRTTAAFLGTLASLGALLIAASAARPGPAPDPQPGPVSQTTPPTMTIVHSGSPWWTFVLVAGAAIAATLLVASLVSRIRHRVATVQVAP